MSEHAGRLRRWGVIAGGVVSGLVLAVWLTLWWLTPAPVTGRLVEYHHETPIAGATLTLSRHGWGLNGPERQLVWDKRYAVTTTTDGEGRFRLPLPGPVWLLGSGGGRLVAQAQDFQRLDAGYVAPGADLTLQTVAEREERLPGGTAYLGWDESGEPFGWSFIDHAPVRDPARADLFPVDLEREPLRVTLAAVEGGGLHFVSAEAQGIAHPSYDYLLRYRDVSPVPPSNARLTLDDTPGTLFLRTARYRHAKLAWAPGEALAMSGSVPGLYASSERLLSLRFVYRPGPGSELPFQPPLARVDPLRASVLAQLPDQGEPYRGPRRYRLVVTDAEGRELERQRFALAPGEPLDLASCAGEAPFAWRFEDVRLDHDDEGLPRLQMTIQGRTFVHHSAPRLVGTDRDTVFAVMAFDAAYRRHDLEVRIREVNEASAALGCAP